MEYHDDPLYRLIKSIESTQEAIANAAGDPARQQQLQEILHNQLARLNRITHEYSVQEKNNHDQGVER